jgi:hypothetical protein
MGQPDAKTATIPAFVSVGNDASIPADYVRDPKLAMLVEAERKKAVELFAEPVEGLNKALRDKG